MFVQVLKHKHKATQYSTARHNRIQDTEGPGYMQTANTTIFYCPSDIRTTEAGARKTKSQRAREPGSKKVSRHRHRSQILAILCTGVPKTSSLPNESRHQNSWQHLHTYTVADTTADTDTDPDDGAALSGLRSPASGRKVLRTC